MVKLNRQYFDHWMQRANSLEKTLILDTDIKNRLLDSVREGEGEMIWENTIETCILPYVK